jgi:peptide deformylase
MSILEVKKSGNGWAEHPLREVAAPCDVRDPAVARLAIDMLHTLLAHDGMGLAAPQVGQSVRLIVMRTGPNDGCPRAFVNPQIIRFKGEQLSLGEGCLSVPGRVGRVLRPAIVWMRYEDLGAVMQEGHPDAPFVKRVEKFKGIMAVCAAHEIDHLDGLLFIDKLYKPFPRRRT